MSIEYFNGGVVRSVETVGPCNLLDVCMNCMLGVAVGNKSLVWGMRTGVQDEGTELGLVDRALGIGATPRGHSCLRPTGIDLDRPFYLSNRCC